MSRRGLGRSSRSMTGRCCSARRCSPGASGCATPSMPTISPPSTTSRASWCRRAPVAQRRPVLRARPFGGGRARRRRRWRSPRRRCGAAGSVREIGGLIGTLVSALFLFAIAIVNLVIFRSTWRTFRRVRGGRPLCQTISTPLLAAAGCWRGCAGRCSRLIARPWHMLLLGFLFGLGFDTATEIGAARPLRQPGRERPAVLLGPGLSGAVRRRHVAGRHAPTAC